MNFLQNNSQPLIETDIKTAESNRLISASTLIFFVFDAAAIYWTLFYHCRF